LFICPKIGQNQQLLQLNYTVGGIHNMSGLNTVNWCRIFTWTKPAYCFGI